jgi:hypothetical protein
MVETPSATLIESITTEEVDGKSEKEELLVQHRETYIIESKPITSSACAAVKHLRTQHGWLSRFRGMGVSFLHFFFAIHLSHLLAIFMPFGLAVLGSAAIFANMRMLITHVMISQQTGKFWLQRLPPRSQWKKVVGPTLLVVLAEHGGFFLPVMLWKALGLKSMAHATGMDLEGVDSAAHMACVTKIASIAIITFIYAVALIIPLKAALARIHASYLPQEEATIVHVHDEQAMSLKTAWQSLDRKALFRVYKAYATCAVMQSGLLFVAAAAVAAQAVLAMGPQVFDIVEAMYEESQKHPRDYWF